jgi:branched-chain amino acid transport system substrate-binding protein
MEVQQVLTRFKAGVLRTHGGWVRPSLIGGLVVAASLATAAIADTPASSAASSPIVIGLSTPLAAASGGYGVPIAEGLKLEVNAVNKAGGIKGHQLDLNIQDNQCTAAGGVTATEKLLSLNPKPIAILGGFCSDATASVLNTIKTAKVPLLIDGAAASEITDTAGVGGNPWLFRWVDDNQEVAQAALQSLAALKKYKSIAIVADNLSYGEDGAASLKAAAKKFGIKVLSTDSVNTTSPDFAPIIARIASEKPGAVAVWMTTSGNFYTEYGQSSLKTVPIIGQLDLTQKAITSDDLQGWDTYQYSPGMNTPQNKAFLKVWHGAKQSDTSALEGYDGYEGGEVLVAALKKAKSFTPAGVQAALKGLDFGPTIAGGTIKFNAHNQAYDNVAVIAVHGSKESTTILKPSQIK